MSKSKFFIYGGGRWREVEDGRVAGWAGSSFVYLKRGKLCIANRRAVIQGLKQLADGRPSSVKIGIPLSQVRDEDLLDSTNIKGNQNGNCHCHRKNLARCNTDANFNKLLKPTTHTVAIQCSPTKNVSIQVHGSQPQNSQQLPSEEIDVQKINKSKERPQIQKNSQNYCKELLIDEADVTVFRSFLDNDENNIFNVDLLRYDEDDDYKKLVFYKINPLVNVVRDKNIQKILDDRSDRERMEFAQVLGLRSVNDPMMHRKISKRKTNEGRENLNNEVRKFRSAAVKLRGKMSSGKRDASKSDDMLANFRSNFETNECQVQIEKLPQEFNKRSDVGSNSEVGKSVNKISGESAISKVRKKPLRKWISKSTKIGRDYSRLEDDAIVTWILNNNKAKFVNGNRVWRNLEPEHHSKTGQFRSWHSLRNRYLRYILPSLGSMSLPQADITSLRAAASNGELNARKIQRRNSIFKTAKVKSAWAVRPQAKSQDEGELSSPRPLRSNTKASPLRKKLPTYSEITRKFALRHRSTPNSDKSDHERRQSAKNTISDAQTAKNDPQTSKNTKNDAQTSKNTKNYSDTSKKDSKDDPQTSKTTKNDSHTSKKDSKTDGRIPKITINDSQTSKKDSKTDGRIPKITINDSQTSKNDTRASKVTKDDSKTSKKSRNERQTSELNQLKESMDENGEITIQIADSDDEFDTNNSHSIRQSNESKISETDSPQVNNIRIRLLRDKKGRYTKAKIVETHNETNNNLPSTSKKLKNDSIRKFLRKQRRRYEKTDEHAENSSKKAKKQSCERNDTNESEENSGPERKTKRNKSNDRKKSSKNNNDSSSSSSDEESNFRSRTTRLETSKSNNNNNTSNNQNVRKTQRSVPEKSQNKQIDKNKNTDNENIASNKKEEDSTLGNIRKSRSKNRENPNRNDKGRGNDRKSRKRERERNERENLLEDTENLNSPRSRSNSIEKRHAATSRRQEKLNQSQKATDRQEKEKNGRQKSQTDKNVQSKRLADEIHRQAKKPRIQYESDLSDVEDLLCKYNSSSSDNSSIDPQTKSPSKVRLQFEDDTSSNISSDSLNNKTDRQTRLSKNLADKSSKNADNDRQKRTRRLFNPTAFMKTDK